MLWFRIYTLFAVLFQGKIMRRWPKIAKYQSGKMHNNEIGLKGTRLLHSDWMSLALVQYKESNFCKCNIVQNIQSEGVIFKLKYRFHKTKNIKESNHSVSKVKQAEVLIKTINLK